MNQPWSDLSNAHHIDWVLASLKNNPEMWIEARDLAPEAARVAATATAAARASASEAWDAASEAWDAASEAWDAAYNLAWNATKWAAWDAILALVAYDDCDQYLTMNYEELRIWAALSEHPAAVLLLPMVYVREKINEPALV